MTQTVPNPPGSDRPFQLHAPFGPAGDQLGAIDSLCLGLSDGLAHQVLLGVTGSGKTFTIANVLARKGRPALILAPNKTLAAQLYGEMKEFFPKNAVEYFVSYYDYYQPEAYLPVTDTFIEKDAAINESIEQMRLSATKALLERRDVIVVASVSAIYGLGDPNAYLKMILHLRVGALTRQSEILGRLTELQYERNDIAFVRGKFQVRGEIINIYPAEAQEVAVRIVLSDEEIEALFLFDPLTGKTLQSIPRYTIYPKTHYATPRDTVLKAIETIKAELFTQYAHLLDTGKLVEAARLKQRTEYDLEMVLEIGYCSGVENYSRHLSGRNAGEPPPTLFDYLPADGLLIIDESHVTIPQIGAMYRGDRSRKETLVAHGFRLPSALDNRPLTFEEFEGLAPQTIYVSATPGPYELQKSASDIIEQIVRPTGLLDPLIEVRPATSQVDDLLSEILLHIAKKERILVTTLTKRMAEDLTKYLEEHGIKIRYMHSDIHTIERVEIIRDLRLGTFDVLVGINLLREGLDLPEVSLVAILDADKEGFLRSSVALIQTIGRAARHVSGKVILYANSITASMKKAIEETERRRTTQATYNLQHKVTPTGITKSINSLMDWQASPVKAAHASARRLEDFLPDEPFISEKSCQQYLKKLKKRMVQEAKNLNFEMASILRDAIERIEKDFSDR